MEISKSDAARIAQQACAEKDISWQEPYSVRQGWRWWRVTTPSNVKGGNAVILVGRKSGVAKVRYFER